LTFSGVDNFELAIVQVRSARKGKLLLACAEAAPFTATEGGMASGEFDTTFEDQAGMTSFSFLKTQMRNQPRMMESSMQTGLYVSYEDAPFRLAVKGGCHDVFVDEISGFGFAVFREGIYRSESMWWPAPQQPQKPSFASPNPIVRGKIAIQRIEANVTLAGYAAVPDGIVFSTSDPFSETLALDLVTMESGSVANFPIPFSLVVPFLLPSFVPVSSGF